jgi:hypothetical protein
VSRLRDRVVQAAGTRGELTLYKLDRATGIACARCGGHATTRWIAVHAGHWTVSYCKSCFQAMPHQPAEAGADGPLLRPAYDLTNPDDACRYLEDESPHARTHPPGREPHQAARLAVIADMARGPRAARPAVAEALAALTLLVSLRDWLAQVEPRLIDAARAQGATRKSLAGVLPAGDRRSAQRGARLARTARLARPPAGNRPPADVARYDELLPSRRRPQPPDAKASSTSSTGRPSPA